MDVGTDLSKLNTGLNAAKAQVTEFAAKSNSLLGTIGLGLSAAAAVKFLADTSEKGSHLVETMSKVREVFKGSTESVTAMANQMADQFGSVKSVTLDAASNLGLVAQGAGMSARQAADLSIKLTRLADDASSFYNVDLDIALEKIRSGLVGEAEPLRAFGVLLSEDAVKAKAAAMGIKAVHGELTEQEKVMARVQLITEGLSKAQGDHMRTMDGYANQIRKLKGEVENYQALVGAGMAAAEAKAISTVQKEGFLAGIGKMTMMAHAAGGGGPKQANVGENVFLQGALEAAGAQKGGFARVEPPIFDQIRMALAGASMKRTYEFESKKYEAPGMAGMNLMNAMQGGFGFGSALNLAGARVGLDDQIAAQRKGMNAWGGGHVMDSESFMRQAQERILRPEDDTAKKQLAELIKAREALDKIAGKQEGKAAVGKMILKGRES